MTPKKIQDTITRYRSEILNGKYVYGQILPSEKELAGQLSLSRPTVAKIYNTLKREGLIRKTPGLGTTVIFNGETKRFTFGLLLPGAGESEIFGAIHDHFLSMERDKNVKFLWDGAIANDAQVRQNNIMKICEHYIEERIKGVFFAPLERTEAATAINHKVCEFFEKQNIPIVLIDRDIESFPRRSKYHVVGLDNFNAGYVMARHLLDAGCERILFFYRRDSANSVNMRIAGCRAACFDAGINFMKDHIVMGEPSDAVLVKKLPIIRGKTGILCLNDSTAAVIMSTLKQIGTVVMKHVIVAGFDDMKYGKVLQPALTTYRQPLKEIVAISHDMMVNKIQTAHEFGADVSLLGEVIARESTRFGGA
ncbi:MAG: GntR family transcriptional regulator [Chryseolinea sp.]